MRLTWPDLAENVASHVLCRSRVICVVDTERQAVRHWQSTENKREQSIQSIVKW